MFALYYSDGVAPAEMLDTYPSLDGATAAAETHCQGTHHVSLKWWRPDLGTEHVGEFAVSYEIPHAFPVQYIINPVNE